MSLKIIQDNFHTQFLNVRNCNNLIQGNDFEIAYNAATPEERRQLQGAINNFDKNKIKEFMNVQIDKLTPFEKLGVRKLRRIGQHLKLPNYQSMSKIHLIEEINNVVSRLKADGQRISFQPEQTKSDAENYIRCR